MTDPLPKNKPRRNNRTKDINKRAAHHDHHDTTNTKSSPPLSSSPISSLNSSLSKKLGRLDQSPSRGHRHRHPSNRNSDRLDRDPREDDGNYKGRPTNFNSRSNPNFHRDTTEEEYYLNDVTDYESPRSRSQTRHNRRGMRRGAAKEEYGEDNYNDDDVRLIRTKSRSRSRQHRNNKRGENIMDDNYEDELPKSRSRNSLHENDAKRGSLHNQKSRGSRSNNNSFHYELEEEEYHENATGRRRSLPKSRVRSNNDNNSFHYDEEEESRSLPKSKGRSNNKKSSSFHYEEDDEYLTPVNDARIKPHKYSRSHSNIDELRQKEPSNSSSLQRGTMHSTRNKHKTNSFHDQQQHEEEEDDYLVGEEVHVKQPPSRVTRRNNNSYTTLYDDDSDSVRDAWSMAKCKSCSLVCVWNSRYSTDTSYNIYLLAKQNPHSRIFYITQT